MDVRVDANPEQGRPEGFFGGTLFVDADEEAVRRATTVLQPPTLTNLVAIAAPCVISEQSKAYTPEHIMSTFLAIYSAFKAVVLETQGRPMESCPSDPRDYDALAATEIAPSPKAIIHTGNWGTGPAGPEGRECPHFLCLRISPWTAVLTNPNEGITSLSTQCAAKRWRLTVNG